MLWRYFSYIKLILLDALLKHQQIWLCPRPPRTPFIILGASLVYNADLAVKPGDPRSVSHQWKVVNGCRNRERALKHIKVDKAVEAGVEYTHNSDLYYSTAFKMLYGLLLWLHQSNIFHVYRLIKIFLIKKDLIAFLVASIAP